MSPLVVEDMAIKSQNRDILDGEWPAMPVETEIYIMPDGRVVVADLPAELAGLMEEWTVVHEC